MSHEKSSKMSRSFVVTRALAAMAGLLGLGCGGALAQADRQAYLPVTFHAQGGAVRTTACLEVIERVEPQTLWWEDADAPADPPERAFKAVTAAMKRKDRAALAKLVDPIQGEGTKDFDDQSGAFFQQFDVIRLVAVPKAYEFDGLLVFFAKVQIESKSFFAPFAFAHEDDGSFGFLPARTRQLTYMLVADWFSPNVGSPTVDDPPYCSDKDVKRATHRVSLAAVPGAAKPAWHPSQLVFVGASFDAPGALAAIAARVKSTIESVKSADFSGGADDFVKHLTPESGEQIKKWLATADDTDRAKYKKAVVQRMERPIFLIDASPLLVVYTRSPGSVQAVYFTAGGNNELLWTNIEHITNSDKLFKRGMLYDAALLDKPFSSLAIK